MEEFKCDSCGCSPEELHMFGFSPNHKGEYCLPCFNGLKSFQSHVSIPETDRELEETERN